MKWLWLASLFLTASLSAAAPSDPRAAAAEIDALLAQDWEKHKVTPNPPASDHTLVRRLYLDLIGRIPTLQETQAFVTSTDANKRAALIDRLLATEAHAQHMFNYWADVLRVQSNANGGQGQMTSKPYVEHVKRRIRENQPYDAFVRELLTAEGKVWDNAAIGYYMRDLGMPLDNLSNTTRIFLGTRIECAQCHNHPFDKWTQMQFYQLAAFTYPVETNFTGIDSQKETMALRRAAEKDPKTAPKARYLGMIFENLGDFIRYSKVQALPTRLLKLPHDYQYKDAKPHDVIAPATMLGQKVTCEPTGKTTHAFADWLTSPSNPRFTTVIANRMWKRAFGLALIEPLDELMDSTVPSHPALMKHLEQLMIACRYDLKAFQRILYNTRAYQNEVTRAEYVLGETYHFPGPLLRRMTAEQMYDSFITLIHPTPDLPRRHGIDPESAERLTYRGKLSDALDLLTSQEIVNGSLIAADAYDANAARSKVLKDQFTVAQKAKDKALMEKLNLDIRSLNFTSRQGIHDNVVVPAVARLYTKKTQKTPPSPPPVPKPTLEDLKKPGIKWPYIDVPGYEMDRAIPEAEKAAEAARDAIFREEAKRFAIPEANLAAYLKARHNHAREWPRSAHLDSPAPRGHYLREFGQSDRDMIENANSDASMPQALVLMNSQLFQSMMAPHTQLTLNLAAAKYPDDQFTAVYQTLLSRPPTDREKEAWQKAQQSGLTTPEDLIYALINTQQFIFVQ
ncbi:MAG TPA: DUF1549 domain-containing protein [Prosthecobacter sp.]|nr:DUF1549 domain-containing protein [Prosthecobacter sp.]